MGSLLLAGGGEFDEGMKAPDLRAISVAGGKDVPISIVPAAAAPDNNHENAGNHGLRWFQRLGATDVSVVGLIDAVSAGDPAIVAALRNSRLIYLLGGFPRHLAQSLAGSAGWKAIMASFGTGAVVAGSSAGAMVLCESYYDPDTGRVLAGLNLLPGTCILPHHNTFGQHWATKLRQQLPGKLLIGIDEQTGMIGNLGEDRWEILGKGGVTLYRRHGTEYCGPGEVAALDG